MSRAQEGQVVDTAKSQNQTLNANSTTAFGAVPGDIATQQGDVNNFQSQLGKFASANPYVAGGEFQTAQNQQLADTAAGVSDATKQAVEGASVRTGANVGGAVAGAEEAAQQAQRTMGGQVAGANQERIGQEAGYNEKALGGYQAVPGMQAGVTGQQMGLAKDEGELAAGALGEEQKAGEMPSYAEQQQQAANTIVENGANRCWIAAELWGGWADPRTILVRRWLGSDFRAHWYGPTVLAAYGRWGKRMAKKIQTRKRLRRFFQWLFNLALKKAVGNGGR